MAKRLARRSVFGGLAGLILCGAAPADSVLDAGRWAVVRESSSITLSVRALGANHAGRFGDWSGDIRFDPERPEQARVAINVRAASLRMEQTALTNRATGPAFLDTTAHPEIRFQLRSLEPLAPDRFTARADVTVKGRTRPVVFPVTLRVQGDAAQMSGGFSLDRAAYDIGTSGPWNGMIARQVRVDVSLATRRA